MLDHQDPVVLLDRRLLLSEALAQVHDGNDLAAQVDHAFQIIGRVRHSGNLGHPHNFVQGRDGHAVSLAAHLKTYDMEFAAHALETPRLTALRRWPGAHCGWMHRGWPVPGWPRPA